MIGPDESGAAAMLPPGLPVLRAALKPGPGSGAARRAAGLRLCGIANPPKFFATLTEAGVVLAGREAFADHYPFDEGDMRDLLAEAEELRAIPVTTRKDWVRIPPAFRSRVHGGDGPFGMVGAGADRSVAGAFGAADSRPRLSRRRPAAHDGPRRTHPRAFRRANPPRPGLRGGTPLRGSLLGRSIRASPPRRAGDGVSVV
jgi:hypothetical protein